MKLKPVQKYEKPKYSSFNLKNGRFLPSGVAIMAIISLLSYHGEKVSATAESSLSVGPEIMTFTEITMGKMPISPLTIQTINKIEVNLKNSINEISYNPSENVFAPENLLNTKKPKLCWEPVFSFGYSPSYKASEIIPTEIFAETSKLKMTSNSISNESMKDPFLPKNIPSLKESSNIKLNAEDKMKQPLSIKAPKKYEEMQILVLMGVAPTINVLD